MELVPLTMDPMISEQCVVDMIRRKRRRPERKLEGEREGRNKYEDVARVGGLRTTWRWIYPQTFTGIRL